eukprot:gnl/MRDRNA2_/MRDRNA2_347655_c0_seq1.p1 gnl/MRDRNA2_/MRDRNA2_347655_c0~~gnl/MRDRNA2_/MRDRNA2_347655_c0_seq1.p1  ORF type:complete len:150 (+),score=23.52 gnl/MRDRNA2_/MRDRNA2_347655_c0_seq1:24-452(+)
MAAAIAGLPRQVNYLLKMRADGSIAENQGYTALHVAAHYGHTAVGEVLLQHGFDANDRLKDGYTPLHRACWGDHPVGDEQAYGKFVELLLEWGVHPEEASKNGFTCSGMTKNKWVKEVIRKAIKDVRGIPDDVHPEKYVNDL